MDAVTPLISVVMPVYNGETYLHEAIESILNQTYSDFEFIIINDGSTDNSWHVIKEYAEKDPRIVPITQENIGLTKSLNNGIQMAKGKYIARQDADDISLCNRLQTQITWSEDKGFDLCCSRTWLIKEGRVSPRIWYFFPKPLLLCMYNPFVHGTYLIRKEAIVDIGGYDESFLYGQDYRLATQLYAKGKRVKYLRECLYKTRKTKSSIGQIKRKEQKKCGELIRKKWCKDLLTNPVLLFKIVSRSFL